jgi:monovalent cation:H+ antiporter, CPA1 family
MIATRPRLERRPTLQPFDVLAIVVTATALLGYANERWIRMPTAIGVMVGGLVVSFGLIATSLLGLGGEGWADALMARIDLGELLLGSLLSFLLFAGALQVDLSSLLERRWTILILATLGTVASTLLVGYGMRAVAILIGVDLPLPFALLFGALISPTDPVAILAILKRLGAPPDLQSLVTGESLFNDGVGVVLFSILLTLAVGGENIHPGEAVLLFIEEALGGVLYGASLGLVAFHLLKRIDNYGIEILITLAVVTGGYALASTIHVSGPLAVVIAGLFIGNRGRAFAMSDITREHLDIFWMVVDEILNAVLFVLIGLELIILDLEPAFLLAGAAAIAVSLLARLVSVAATIGAIRLRVHTRPYTVRLMTWGGLRGGIAVALALSIPASSARDLILVLTYCVVVFSILVQGLTVERLVRRAGA